PGARSALRTGNPGAGRRWEESGEVPDRGERVQKTIAREGGIGGKGALPAHPARPANPALFALFPRDDEVSAAILLPAALVRFAAEGLLLALADHGNAIGGHAEADQILLDGVGAARSEPQVVL